jgi:hypothetical protein
MGLMAVVTGFLRRFMDDHFLEDFPVTCGAGSQIRRWIGVRVVAIAAFRPVQRCVDHGLGWLVLMTVPAGIGFDGNGQQLSPR